MKLSLVFSLGFAVWALNAFESSATTFPNADEIRFPERVLDLEKKQKKISRKFKKMEKLWSKKFHHMKKKYKALKKKIQENPREAYPLSVQGDTNCRPVYMRNGVLQYPRSGSEDTWSNWANVGPSQLLGNIVLDNGIVKASGKSLSVLSFIDGVAYRNCYGKEELLARSGCVEKNIADSLINDKISGGGGRIKYGTIHLKNGTLSKNSNGGIQFVDASNNSLSNNGETFALDGVNYCMYSNYLVDIKNNKYTDGLRNPGGTLIWDEVSNTTRWTAIRYFV